MTAADPKGVFVDTIRTCYASWMRVPEYADPIRVRWYKIDRPPPGSYPITEYSSSDWDEDPKSNDPDLGEQSTLREPFKDWRDCSPPPWGDFRCDNAATPAAEYYTCVLSDLVGVGYTTTLNGTYLLFNRLPCYWDGVTGGAFSAGTIILTVDDTGNASCAVFETDPPGSMTAVASALYLTTAPPAMDRVFTIPLSEVIVPGVNFPPFLTLTPTYIPPPGNLATEKGRNLLAENGHPLHTEAEELP